MKQEPGRQQPGISGLKAGEDVKMDALVSPSDIGLLCAALQQAMDRLELETE